MFRFLVVVVVVEEFLSRDVTSKNEAVWYETSMGFF
jgi:hypothetical protein